MIEKIMLLIVIISIFWVIGESLNPTDIKDNNVHFNINSDIIRGYFNPNITIEVGSVAPGDTFHCDVNIPYDELDVTLFCPEIPNICKKTELFSYKIDALGDKRYYIPPAYYNFIGGKIGINLHVKTMINATVDIIGKGYADTQYIQWENIGKESVDVSCFFIANEGDEISIILSEITYIIQYKADFTIEILSYDYDISEIASYQDHIPGQPGSISGTITVIDWMDYHGIVVLLYVLFAFALLGWVVVLIYL